MADSLPLSRGAAMPAEQRVHMNDPDAAATLAGLLRRLWAALRPPTLILCIGTDRSTGDALGPLVGSRLMRAHLPGIRIAGTLDHPVHAANLPGALRELRLTEATVLAVDACLGRLETIGTISLGRGAIRPGAGVNKSLPAVGDYHITATVNVGGFMEYFVLQNTRLAVVMKMADIIADALIESLSG
ncbi:spore-specific protease [Candidatus Hydrogenisulfobacillus filiaventi]|uniref:Spore-specific protease n=1 Tax=Candidatus Hydrogenisulfobacillus filiaventi TaxID=2707344 RepID=A0A6F8ZJV3_9FIRM|nr:spore protease YyaC [Bacillota bacterium]CAB1130269.1 spore-specific protease [Candidatus Hydrogenisulfobacillus filiaventi]